MVDPNHIRPGDFVSFAIRHCLNASFRRGRWWRRTLAGSLVWQESEWNAENIHVFGREESRLFVDLIGSTPQAATNNLLAKQLRCERAQAHDVRDCSRVPSF